MEPSLLRLQNAWWDDPSAIERDQHIVQIRGKSYAYDPPLVHELSLQESDLHILRGPRQVGKTTILKLIIRRLLAEGKRPSSILYMSCESIRSFEDLISLVTAFIQSQPSPDVFLFLDEVSFVSEWQRAVLALWNTGLLQKAATVVTGSNARDLKESAERLPGRRGRGRDHRVYPLSLPAIQSLACFREKSMRETLDLYMRVGGFPIAIRDYVELGMVSDATYETYRNWIVGDASRFGLRQETLKQILFRLFQTIATRVTWPKLIEDSPVKSHETALEYVEHLQDAFLCLTVSCYDERTHGASGTKPRKIYPIDPLLVAVAGTWRDSIPNVYRWLCAQIDDSAFRGRFFEGIVVNHLARNNDRLFYWYSPKNKKEVDIVLPKEKGVDLYDVKWKAQAPSKVRGQTVTIIDPESFLHMIS